MADYSQLKPFLTLFVLKTAGPSSCEQYKQYYKISDTTILNVMGSSPFWIKCLVGTTPIPNHTPGFMWSWRNKVKEVSILKKNVSKSRTIRSDWCLKCKTCSEL